MITIKYWEIYDCETSEEALNEKKMYKAQGFALGHPRLGDGIYFHTSAIQTIRTGQDCLNMTTRSGNRYTLMLEDINMEYLDKTNECLKFFGISQLSSDTCKTLAARAEKERMAKADRILQEQELHLQLIGIDVYKAYFKCKGGAIHEIIVDTHLGTFQDSYLVTDSEHGVDFRYFDRITWLHDPEKPVGDSREDSFYMAIAPYFWKDSIQAVIIDNLSSKDIGFICGLGGDTIICKAGEITRIERSKYKDMRARGTDFI